MTDPDFNLYFHCLVGDMVISKTHTSMWDLPLNRKTRPSEVVRFIEPGECALVVKVSSLELKILCGGLVGWSDKTGFDLV